jgi:hypothetical protein
MNKKLMLLVAAALAALAFSALAGTATAKETNLKCDGAGFCTFTVSSGVTNISMIGGDTVRCTGVSGQGEVTNLNAERESSTGTVQLLFNICKEQNTVFHFSCSNTATSGNITTNVMTMHSVALPETTTKAGVVMTNAGVTFTCAGGFASTQLTGSIIGESETACGTNTGFLQKVSFNTFGDGWQHLTTYTGATPFKLEGKTSHSSGGSYTSAALESTANFNYNQNVYLTCA